MLAPLPAPRIALLLGGNSGAQVFTAAKSRRLGALVNGFARAQGGSLLVTDSARTPPGVTDALLGEIDVPLHCHRWGGPRESNPYLGYLALAEQFVVTADSMSMVAEAEYTGRPVYLFSLEDGPDWWRRGYNYRFRPLTHRLAMRWGPRRMRRDVRPMLDA
jgi:mitochondrial fission protein ELM1